MKRTISGVGAAAVICLMCCMVTTFTLCTSVAWGQNEVNTLLETRACPGCDLQGAELVRAELAGANLEGADLTGARLYLADLAGANLKNCNLSKALLGGADLAGADLRGANLTGAQFDGAYTVGAIFEDGPAASSLVEKDLQATQVAASVSTNQNTASVEPVSKPDVSATVAATTVTMMEPQKKSVEQEEVPQNTSQQLAQQPVAVESQIEQPVAAVKEEPTTIPDEAVVEVVDDQIDESKDAKDVDKDKKHFLTQFLKSKRCYGCDLSGLDLKGKNLKGSDLEQADLSGSNLAGAILKKANLKGARLVGANLAGADLTGADLYKADLTNADLTGCEINEAIIEDTVTAGVTGASL